MSVLWYLTEAARWSKTVHAKELWRKSWRKAANCKPHAATGRGKSPETLNLLLWVRCLVITIGSTIFLPHWATFIFGHHCAWGGRTFHSSSFASSHQSQGHTSNVHVVCTSDENSVYPDFLPLLYKEDATEDWGTAQLLYETRIHNDPIALLKVIKASSEHACPSPGSAWVCYHAHCSLPSLQWPAMGEWAPRGLIHVVQGGEPQYFVQACSSKLMFMEWPSSQMCTILKLVSAQDEMFGTWILWGLDVT